MRKELLTNKDGSSYYSFVYYNAYDKRRIRLSRSYIRQRFGKDVTDSCEADAIISVLEKDIKTLGTEKIKRLPDDQYGFQPLIALYTEWQCKAAPNSFRNNIHYLKYYVLPFFLGIKRCQDLEGWHIYYDDFREWLEEGAFLLKKPGTLISYASKNHCIRALNTFMAHMTKKRYLAIYHSCEAFPSYRIREKSADDIVWPEEMEAVYGELLRAGYRDEAVFYRLLFFSGLRFNEACGLSLGDVYEGQIDDTAFHRRLHEYGLGYSGYLVIDSQPVRRRRLKDDDGHVPRKPLKGRKRIDEKSARLIPITDTQLWKDLVQLYNEALRSYEKRVWGSNLKDYLLFGAMESTASERLRRTYESLGLVYRSWHCLRHTRATYLIGETGDFLLTRLWLGHKSQNVLDRYNHVYQAVVRQAKKGVNKDLKPLME